MKMMEASACLKELNDENYLAEADEGWEVHAECAPEVKVGSLTKCIKFWQEIGASKFIQTIILLFTFPRWLLANKDNFAWVCAPLQGGAALKEAYKSS